MSAEIGQSPMPTESGQSAAPFVDLQLISQCLQLSDLLERIKIKQHGHKILDIDVPQMVIVGDQSHGKTRLVEGISGVKLPQGDGTVTKLPLHMKIYSTSVKKENDTRVRYFGAGHDEAEPWMSLPRERVSLHVDQLTQKYAPKELVLDGSRIEVEVHIAGLLKSSTVGNGDLSVLLLSVTDLPGMTRVASKNQQDDIEEGITRMYERYIQDSSTIILNIISAHVDFATSTSLKLSRRNDPNGSRTYVVVTKCDHEPKGTPARVRAACDQLGIPLDKVFFTMNAPSSLPETSLIRKWKNESEFFRRHSAFSAINVESLGCQQLAGTLSRHHADLISKSLPEIFIQLEAALHRIGVERSQMAEELGIGDPLFDQSSNVMKFSSWSLKWIEAIKQSLRGRAFDEANRDGQGKTLSALRIELDSSFQRMVRDSNQVDSLHPDFNGLKNRLRVRIENTAGVPGMPGARDPNAVMAAELSSMITTFQEQYVPQYVHAHRERLLLALSEEMKPKRIRKGVPGQLQWPLLSKYVEEKVVAPVIHHLANKALEAMKLLGRCEGSSIICSSGEYEHKLTTLRQPKPRILPQAAEYLVQSASSRLPSDITEAVCEMVEKTDPTGPEIDPQEALLNDLDHQARAYWAVFLNRFLDSASVLVNGLIYHVLCEELHCKISYLLLNPPSTMELWFKPSQCALNEYQDLMNEEEWIQQALALINDITHMPQVEPTTEPVPNENIAVDRSPLSPKDKVRAFLRGLSPRREVS